MTKATNTGPDLAERAGYLIELAARAPSVHNTQPWRFSVIGQAIELYADASRQLMEDLTGREMIISCGAALFGLRLAIRSLGCQPEVDLFPEPSQRHLLARVRAGRPEPMTPDERAMLRAVPHRHTHAARSKLARCPAACWHGRLPQRDFDLGRGWGFPPSGGPPAPVTAVLVAEGEDEQSWLRAGQALQRILLRAASHVHGPFQGALGMAGTVHSHEDSRHFDLLSANGALLPLRYRR